MIKYKDFGPIAELLGQLQLIGNPERLQLLQVGTRDEYNVRVYQCPTYGVIFLDRIVDKDPDYKSRQDARTASFSIDNGRRKQYLANIVKDKHWVDVGCGTGGLLWAMRDTPQWSIGVEPDARYAPQGSVRSIDGLPNDYFDVATLMHSFEHMHEPLYELKQMRKKLRKNGRIFIEVPHAKDFLIQWSKEFRLHTFWSEHRILHTRDSLRVFLGEAGFRDIHVTGIQRYGLANHFKWLIKSGKDPQDDFKSFDYPTLKHNYEGVLSAIDATDSLWAEAKS